MQAASKVGKKQGMLTVIGLEKAALEKLCDDVIKSGAKGTVKPIATLPANPDRGVS